jgi:ribose 1,5-bisphosphokinase PhnN
VISNVSRGIVAQMREKYASVDAVLITAPTAILAVRLGRRTRETDGSVFDRIKRNDAFAGFRPDHVIETTGAPEDAVRRLLDVIRGSTARLSP